MINEKCLQQILQRRNKNNMHSKINNSKQQLIVKFYVYTHNKSSNLKKKSNVSFICY